MKIQKINRLKNKIINIFLITILILTSIQINIVAEDSTDYYNSNDYYNLNYNYLDIDYLYSDFINNYNISINYDIYAYTIQPSLNLPFVDIDIPYIPINSPIVYMDLDIYNVDPRKTDNIDANGGGGSTINRYTILILDTSSSQNFLLPSGGIFTANTAVPYVRIAAGRFVQQIQDAPGNNYVALIQYRGPNAQLLSGFTTNEPLLNTLILNLSPLHSTRNAASAFDLAYNLLNNISTPNAIKNVVIFSTGMTNDGQFNYTGRYNFETVGSRWFMTGSGIHLFAFANVAFEASERVRSLATIHSIGLFQNLDSIPEDGRDIVEFFRLTAHDWATSSNHFHDVSDPNDLYFIFGDIADNIVNQYPIIVIPGIMGSSLEHNGDVVWLYTDWVFGELWAFVNRVRRLELNQRGESRNIITPIQGVYGTTSGWLPLATPEQLRPYQEMMRYLRFHFPNRDVHFWPYDWRLDNAHTARLLANFIDSLNANRVDIVAHSMGGLVVSRYIADMYRAGLDNRINTLITIGTPFLGAPKVPYVWATGNMIGKPTGLNISPGPMREISSHMLSAYQLLPFGIRGSYIKTSRYFWHHGSRAYFSPNPVNNPYNFIVNRLPMRGVGGSIVAHLTRQVLLTFATNFQESLWIIEATGYRHAIELVDHFVIVGNNQSTIATTIFAERSDGTSNEASHINNLYFTQGDGTVPLWSANINGRINNTRLAMFNYEHTELMHRQAVINNVINIIDNGNFGLVLPPQPNPRLTVIRIASPIYSSVSRYVYNYDYGKYILEALSSIPGYQNFRTSFGSLHMIGPDLNSELFAIVGDYESNIFIKGNDYGYMTYSIRFYNELGDDYPTAEYIFYSIPINPYTIITSNIDRDRVELNIDLFGDGEYIINMSPGEFPYYLLPDNPDNPNNQNIWDATTIYLAGDIVIYNNLKYQARWWTQNERPDGHNAQNPWLLISTDIILPWRNNIHYHAYSIVSHNGRIYQSTLWVNAGDEPSSDHWGPWLFLRYLNEIKNEIQYNYHHQ